jgi:16S rRNA (guanine966-N2)-methyltransferase
VRIISGKFKGRRIFPPKNLPVRPTTDMSKEALFNVLNNHFSFDSLKVLDGDFGCVKFIKQVAEEYDFNIAAIKSDVFKFLEKNSNSYDIIFADPPYALDQKVFESLVLLVFKQNLLENEGMMIIEHSKYTNLDHLTHFSFKKSYGGSIFSFFEINPSEK